MYISNAILFIFFIFILLSITFIITMTRTRQITLLHKFYFAAITSLIVWILAIFAIRCTNPGDIRTLELLDVVTTTCAAMIPPFSLLFVVCYINKYERTIPKQYWTVFIVPIVTAILVFTNPLHHWYYKTFSLVSSEIEFGPYFVIHSFYSFSCVAVAVVLMIRFAITTKTKLHILQAVLFIIGSIAPSIFNLVVLSGAVEATIAFTPISFMITIIFHGFVIYKLHLFDIKPIAMQQLVNCMGDCYLVVNQDGLVITCNQPFMELLGNQHGIKQNISLQSCVQNEDVENKTAIYNLLNAITCSKETSSKTTYEQAISIQSSGEISRSFYMVEVSPLIVIGDVCGFLTIFKDVTQIKINMQRLQDSQVKMMEQERLAFLGQMVGGLAHNLKTPIMSISGSLSAVENLVQECEMSVGDCDVTDNDYLEIYSEMNTWMQRMRESCAYMSDIITAVKGQASNMNVSTSVDFSLEEAFKRVTLLLRHELLNNHCTLQIDPTLKQTNIFIHGDINNLVQVITNLVSNSIDAQQPNGRHDIIATIDRNDENLKISIKDFGCGISEKVRNKLFHQMITSKGNLGTGLGIFISNTVIHAKFDGSMWIEDNPEGGSIFGIEIPLKHVTFKNIKG